MTEEARRNLRLPSESFENGALVGAAVDVFIRSGIPFPGIFLDS
jgi:hypothetical protein